MCIYMADADGVYTDCTGDKIQQCCYMIHVTSTFARICGVGRLPVWLGWFEDKYCTICMHMASGVRYLRL